jgi:hypothetical protein
LAKPTTHDRICIRLPVAVVSELRKQGSPNHYIGEIIDTFDWHSLPYDPGFSFEGVELEQLTIKVTIAGKAAFTDYGKYHQKEQRITLMQAIAARQKQEAKNAKQIILAIRPSPRPDDRYL